MYNIQYTLLVYDFESLACFLITIIFKSIAKSVSIIKFAIMIYDFTSFIV